MPANLVILGNPAAPGPPLNPLFPPYVVPPLRTALVAARLVNSAGETINLLSPEYLMGENHEGLDGGDSDLDEDELSGIDGSYVVGSDSDQAGLLVKPLLVVLPVLVRGRDPFHALELTEHLRRVLSVRRYGPATLHLTRRDGQTRQIKVYHVYKRKDFGATTATARMRPVILRLTAPDPFFLVPQPPIRWKVGSGGGGELPLEFPWELQGSSLVGQVNQVPINGEELTWPRVRVHDTFESVSLSRGDKMWQMTAPGPVPAGSDVTLNHNPRANLGGGQVLGPSGESWYEYLADGSELFALRPGTENLTVQVVGGGPDTYFEISWDARTGNAL